MADEHVRTAVAYWGPRFVTNGVPIGDFQEVTGGLESWEEWCAAWCARAAVHERLGDEALEQGNGRSAGEHLVRAALCYHFGKFLFVQDPAQHRAAHDRAVAAHRRALPHLDPPAERVEIPFGPARLAGNLRLPRGSDGPVPVVVMVSGLDSTKEEQGTSEQTFLDRGLATLAFDGPGQGEAEFEWPMRHDFEAPVAAVVDYVETRAELDAGRVGLWGVSLGGHYVIRAAAFEPRISACVSLSGSYRVADTWPHRPLLNRRAYQVRGHLDSDTAAAEFIRSFDLTGVAGKVNCPTYVLGGTADRLTPPSAAQRIAAEVSGPAVLNLVEGGNHVASNKPYAYRPQSADWVKRVLISPR